MQARRNAQIGQNPTRSGARAIGWTHCKERHAGECFFNKIRRFRRIALRCEKTASSFRTFIAIACAMPWIAGMKTPPGASLC